MSDNERAPFFSIHFRLANLELTPINIRRSTSRFRKILVFSGNDTYVYVNPEVVHCNSQTFFPVPSVSFAKQFADHNTTQSLLNNTIARRWPFPSVYLAEFTHLRG